MQGANQDPTLRVHPFKQAIAAATLGVVTLAGCTSEHKSAAEHPSPTPAAVQMAGLAAMNLVFVANPNGKNQIFEQSLGSPAKPPVALTDSSCNSNNPQASPDGSELVYYSDCDKGVNQIFTLDLQHHTRTQLTSDAHIQNYDPTFAPGPGGELEIDWKRTDANGNFGRLFEVPARGGPWYDLTPDLDAAKREAWKPSSASVTERVLTVRERQGDPSSDELYLLNVVGSKMRRLTTNKVADEFPSVSSKKVVVYTTKQNGHDVLATMGLDGKGQKVIVDMPGDSDDPSWSADGSTVVFINNNHGKSGVYARNLATGKQALLYEGKHGSALAPIVVPNIASKEGAQ